MDNAVRETMCTKCEHLDVCAYKQTYIRFLSEYGKFRNEYPEDISFIGKSDPECQFCKKKPDVNFR